MSSLVFIQNGDELEIGEEPQTASVENEWVAVEEFISVEGGMGESSKIESRLSRLKSSYSNSFIPLQFISPLVASVDLPYGDFCSVEVFE